MITAQDVTELYRCLLGRSPENDDTVAAFRDYYGDFARGRRAVLRSAEFAELFAREQGDAAARLAQGFLARAGGVVAPSQVSLRPVWRGAMRLVLRAHGAIQVAIVVAGPELALEDLLPFESAHAVVLHISPAFPPMLPQIARLSGGGMVLRVAFEPAPLAAFLAQLDLRIDLLAVFGDAAPWFEALRPNCAGRVILMTDGAMPAETADWIDAEQVVPLDGLAIRFVGGWFLPVFFDAEASPAPVAAPIPGLCVAAIMRNEQAAAVNMLASADPVASSFVVVDTGSADDTIALARAFLQGTQKPFVLTTHAGGRFDAMRNAALELAPADATWILMLDADEELCAADHAALRVLLAGDPVADAFALPRYNYTGLDKSGEVTPYPDRQVRLLRVRAGNPIRYTGAVHETIRNEVVVRLPLDAGALGLGHGGPHIHHLVRRFRSPAAEAAKQAHYRAISEAHE